jgi:hypothetical protein
LHPFTLFSTADAYSSCCTSIQCCMPAASPQSPRLEQHNRANYQTRAACAARLPGPQTVRPRPGCLKRSHPRTGNLLATVPAASRLDTDRHQACDCTCGLTDLHLQLPAVHNTTKYGFNAQCAWQGA